jgi:putative DNA primase/helicase
MQRKYDPPPDLLEGKAEDFTGFVMKAGKVWFQPPPEEEEGDDEDEDQKKERPDAIFVCEGLEILANTHDPKGKNHGRLIAVTTKRGQTNEWIIDSALFEGSGSKIRQHLRRLGLRMNQNRPAKQLLIEYLEEAEVDRDICELDQPGWFGDSYIMPDGEAFGPDIDNIRYLPKVEHNVKQYGTLDEWNHTVARWANNNPLIVFAMCIGYASPFPAKLNLSNTLFHYFGKSGDGKSTAGRCLASLIGSGEDGEYISTYDQSSKAIVAGLAGFHGGFRLYDELRLCPPADAARVAYAACSGVGAERTTATGAMQKRKRSRGLHFRMGK